MISKKYHFIIWLFLLAHLPGCDDLANGVGDISRANVFENCPSNSNDVEVGDVHISTSEDIEALPACFVVAGNLVISNTSLESIKGLSRIGIVNGDLIIQNNYELKSLAGIKGLGHVGGAIKIINNDSLIDLSELAGISSAGSIVVADNRQLANLHGLDNLKYTTGVNGVVISGNDSLIDVLGLAALRQTYGMRIEHNHQLKSLQGLQEISSLRHLVVSDNSQLMSLDGLQGLSRIDSLSVIGNPLLISLHGLNNLVQVALSLRIEQNQALLNLSGLEELIRINNGLYINNNDRLVSLAGLGALSHIEGGVTISGNEQLESIAPLLHVDTILGGINITGTSIDQAEIDVLIDEIQKCRQHIVIAAQDDFSKVDGCTILYGDLTIAGSDLHDLSGLEKLEIIDGHLSIKSNSELISLNGLECLKEVRFGLSISDNQNLVTLKGLDKLEQISPEVRITPRSWLNRFEIVSNEQLQDLSGLQNLHTVGTDQFIIKDNRNLSDLSAISNITEIAGKIVIEGELLADDQVKAFVAGIPICQRSHVVNSFEDLEPIIDCEKISGSLEINTADELPVFRHLKSIGRSLRINNSTNLTDMLLFEGLEEIHETLSLINNPALRSLQGLESLTHVGWMIVIEQHPELSSIAGLANVKVIGAHNVRLGENPKLHPEEVAELISRANASS